MSHHEFYLGFDRIQISMFEWNFFVYYVIIQVSYHLCWHQPFFFDPLAFQTLFDISVLTYLSSWGWTYLTSNNYLSTITRLKLRMHQHTWQTGRNLYKLYAAISHFLLVFSVKVPILVLKTEYLKPDVYTGKWYTSKNCTIVLLNLIITAAVDTDWFIQFTSLHRNDMLLMQTWIIRLI